MDKIILYVQNDGRFETHPEDMEFGPGETYLDEPIPEGAVVRARLEGQDSCVSVWLE